MVPSPPDLPESIVFLPVKNPKPEEFKPFNHSVSHTPYTSNPEAKLIAPNKTYTDIRPYPSILFCAVRYARDIPQWSFFSCSHQGLKHKEHFGKRAE
jgi:hypothetical protein